MFRKDNSDENFVNFLYLFPVRMLKKYRIHYLIIKDKSSKFIHKLKLKLLDFIKESYNCLSSFKISDKEIFSYVSLVL